MLVYDQAGSGLPVVLIHGFPLSRQMWRPQLKSVADAGYRVICPDLPGFGLSPSVETLPTMSGYADALVALLDDLGIDKAVVGGMSMGGYVLLNLVERYPGRLFGAMFLMTRAAADDAAGRKKRTLLATEVRKGKLQAVPDAFIQVLFAPQTLQNRPHLVADVRQMMESTPADGIVGGLLAMRDRPDYLKSLKTCTLPALVVAAEQDLAAPLEHSLAMAEGLPLADLKIIPRAGHMANLEEPELFNQALLEFLSKY